MGFLYSQLFVIPAYPTTSCANQIIIVTGANIGLGREAARHFARLGAAKVILAVRNTEAGEEAKNSITTSTKCGADVLEVWHLDLLSHDSCKSFAERASKLPRVDILLENAGFAASGFALAEGHERMVAVNVISTMYLALLMLPKLKSTAKQFNTTPRLVIVSSAAHIHSQLSQWKEPSIFKALAEESRFNVNEGYPISKLLEILIVREIAPKLARTGIILNVLDPGLCHSGLNRNGSWALAVIKLFIARSTEVGSRTLVAAGTAGPESHGKYMVDGKVDDNALSKFARSAEGKEAGRKVWKELSEIFEGIHPGVTGIL